MEKKINKGRIIDIFPVFSKANFKHIEKNDRKKLFKVHYLMKNVFSESNKIRQEAVEKFKPENYDTEIAGFVDRFNTMSMPEREAALANDKKMADAIKTHISFLTDVDACVADERVKDAVLDIVPLSDDAFNSLLDSNPEWTIGESEELMDMLCGSGESGKE